ncbi:MFS transporter permease [uncultured Brevundimonas sp.]|uniref:MFS transporter permease n=1 Tax=uncultured Brevundimonas sp. TaxID=213418 RepID=UPI0030EDD2FA|tara:strand:- start:335 stop:745 length:411 start_codon:yes stop_codon:yes gene_type:complete
MTADPSEPSPGSNTRPAAVDGWSFAAIGAALAAILAWAACCVLPLGLAATGITLAGTAVLADQRSWLTLAAAVVLAAGWLMTWRRWHRSRLNLGCARPSRLNVILLAVATLLLLVALIWQPLLEPPLLNALLRRQP